MKPLLRAARRMRRCEGGTAAIEFAVVGLALILVSIGVVEFGRGLHMRNELSFAADFGARKVLTSATISDSALQEAIRSAIVSEPMKSDPDLVIAVGTESVGSVQFRTIALSYPFSPLVPGIAGPISLSLARRVPVS